VIAVYAAARVLQAFPDRIPLLVITAFHVLPAAVFALLHGVVTYRLRGILIFTGLCLVVGNVVENVGVITGFPFGQYYFTNAMGPKLFPVPILLGLAYVGMGYVLGAQRPDPWNQPRFRYACFESAPRCELHHGRLGSLDGSGLVDSVACLDLAPGWDLFRL
jgi:putative membrane protein